MLYLGAICNVVFRCCL